MMCLSLLMGFNVAFNSGHQDHVKSQQDTQGRKVFHIFSLDHLLPPHSTISAQFLSSRQLQLLQNKTLTPGLSL